MLHEAAKANFFTNSRRCLNHIFMMDVGLFAYWRTGIAGDFTARPITETGVDRPFLVACCVLATSLVVVLLAIWKLREATSTDALTRPV